MKTATNKQNRWRWGDWTPV